MVMLRTIILSSALALVAAICISDTVATQDAEAGVTSTRAAKQDPEFGVKNVLNHFEHIGFVPPNAPRPIRKAAVKVEVEAAERPVPAAIPVHMLATKPTKPLPVPVRAADTVQRPTASPVSASIPTAMPQPAQPDVSKNDLIDNAQAKSRKSIFGMGMFDKAKSKKSPSTGDSSKAALVEPELPMPQEPAQEVVAPEVHAPVPRAPKGPLPALPVDPSVRPITMDKPAVRLVGLAENEVLTVLSPPPLTPRPKSMCVDQKMTTTLNDLPLPDPIKPEPRVRSKSTESSKLVTEKSSTDMPPPVPIATKPSARAKVVLENTAAVVQENTANVEHSTVADQQTATPVCHEVEVTATPVHQAESIVATPTAEVENPPKPPRRMNPQAPPRVKSAAFDGLVIESDAAEKGTPIPPPRRKSMIVLDSKSSTAGVLSESIPLPQVPLRVKPTATVSDEKANISTVKELWEKILGMTLDNNIFENVDESQSANLKLASTLLKDKLSNVIAEEQATAICRKAQKYFGFEVFLTLHQANKKILTEEEFAKKVEFIRTEAVRELRPLFGQDERNVAFLQSTLTHLRSLTLNPELVELIKLDAASLVSCGVSESLFGLSQTATEDRALTSDGNTKTIVLKTLLGDKYIVNAPEYATFVMLAHGF